MSAFLRLKWQQRKKQAQNLRRKSKQAQNLRQPDKNFFLITRWFLWLTWVTRLNNSFDNSATKLNVIG
jgi:hypothetical protein